MLASFFQTHHWCNDRIRCVLQCSAKAISSLNWFKPLIPKSRPVWHPYGPEPAGLIPLLVLETFHCAATHLSHNVGRLLDLFARWRFLASATSLQSWIKILFFCARFRSKKQNDGDFMTSHYVFGEGTSSISGCGEERENVFVLLVERNGQSINQPANQSISHTFFFRQRYYYNNNVIIHFM